MFLSYILLDFLFPGSLSLSLSLYLDPSIYGIALSLSSHIKHLKWGQVLEKASNFEIWLLKGQERPNITDHRTNSKRGSEFQTGQRIPNGAVNLLFSDIRNKTNMQTQLDSFLMYQTSII